MAGYPKKLPSLDSKTQLPAYHEYVPDYGKAQPAEKPRLCIWPVLLFGSLSWPICKALIKYIMTYESETSFDPRGSILAGLLVGGISVCARCNDLQSGTGHDAGSKASWSTHFVTFFWRRTPLFWLAYFGRIITNLAMIAAILFVWGSEGYGWFVARQVDVACVVEKGLVLLYGYVSSGMEPLVEVLKPLLEAMMPLLEAVYSFLFK
ncbi:hypothetical protein H2199_006997 [Coniosporium tulheliwenetii]|uniref:Uncharacterized protein n=1 Tax=Coniosporium tulheliwenetii TaxID=3383036 RepID=A0ACC2YSE0_9PEZI|nr:hypothetical protein H2199_006997 [Cladosporium sp. JES 115]